MDRRHFLCSCCASAAFLRSGFAFSQDKNTLFNVPPAISAEKHFADLQIALRAEALQTRDLIREKADAATAATIDGIRFRFSRQPVNNARAFYDPISRQYVVEMFVGLLIMVEQIALARAFSTVGDFSERGANYIIYLANAADSRRRDPTLVFTAPPLKTWFDFIEMTDIGKAAEFYQRHPDVRRLFDMQCLCSVAFVVGHEIGHHLLGHTRMPPPASPAESRQREEAADDMALSLVAPTPFPAYGAIPAFLSFYIMDPEGSASLQSTHPDPRKRILNVARKSLDSMLHNANFVAYLQRSNQYEKFVEKNQSELDAFAKLVDGLSGP